MENSNTLRGRPAFHYRAGRLGFWVFLENQKTKEHIFMSQEFIPDDNSSDRPNNGPAEPKQEIVKIKVIGSRKAVFKTIHNLYLLGFAAVGDWSPPQPSNKPGEFVSVLIRRSGKM